MEELIENMIAIAKTDIFMRSVVYDLLDELESEPNSPEEWQELGRRTAEKYKDDPLIMEYCNLGYFL